MCVYLGFLRGNPPLFGSKTFNVSPTGSWIHLSTQHLECVISVLQSPYYIFSFVFLKDQLAMYTVSKCPSQLHPTTEDCTMSQIVALFGQQSIKLEGRGFVVMFHMLVDYGFNSCTHLQWPS